MLGEIYPLMHLLVDFAAEQLREKGQDVNVDTKDDGRTLSFRDYSVVLGLDVETAVLTVVYNDGRPKEFDFAKDRHLAPKDVEEYVGRRVVEMARAAQKAEPW